jgi:hypothetical protein
MVAIQPVSTLIHMGRDTVVLNKMRDTLAIWEIYLLISKAMLL